MMSFDALALHYSACTQFHFCSSAFFLRALCTCGGGGGDTIRLCHNGYGLLCFGSI